MAAETTKIYVNAAWTEESVLPEGYIWGENAFNSAKTALESMTADTTEVVLLSDITETVTTPVITLQNDVTLSGNYAINWTISGNDKKAPDTDGMVYIISDNATSMRKFTISEGTTINVPYTEGKLNGAFYIGYSSNTPAQLVVDGTLNTYELYPGTSSKMSVSPTGSLNIGSECLIVRGYAEAAIDGTEGGWSAENVQAKFGYVSLQGGSTTFSNTFVNAGAWISLWNRKNLSGDVASLTVDNTSVVTGAIKTNATEAEKNSKIFFKNNAIVDVSDSVDIGSKDELTIDNSTLNSKSFTNAGVVNVTGTSKLSAGTYAGNLNVGVTGGTTTLTTDGFKQTSDNKTNVFGTVTMTGYDLYNVQIGYGTSSTSSDTLTLDGGSAELVYLGQDSASENTYTLNLANKAAVNSTLYIRHNGVVNVDNTEVTTGYNCIYGKLNITNGATYTVSGSNFYLNGRENKLAKDVATITVDHSTLVFTNTAIGGLEIGGGSMVVEAGDKGSGTLLLNSATVIGTGIFMEDNADGTLGTIAIDSTDSTITLSHALIIGSGDTVTMKNSTITLKSITNKGTITVDMTDAKNAVYKLIDASSDSEYGTCDFASEEKRNGYTLSVVDNDLYATKVDMTNLAVKTDWSGKSVGEEVATIGETTYYYGFNAFSSTQAALDNKTDETTTIVVDASSDTLADNTKLGSITLKLSDSTLTVANDKTLSEGTVEVSKQSNLIGKISSAVVLQNGVTLGSDTNATLSSMTQEKNGSATLKGAQLTLNTGSNAFEIGEDATLTLSNGAYVICNGSSDGDRFSVRVSGAVTPGCAAGTLTMTGTETKLKAKYYFANYGSMTISDGAELVSTTKNYGMIHNKSTGVMTVDGATLTALNKIANYGTMTLKGDNTLTGTENGVENNSIGTMTVESGTTSVTGAVTNAGTITVDGTGSITAASLTNSGSINLGYNTDTKTALITVTGAVTNTTGTIKVDVKDAKETSYLLIDAAAESAYGTVTLLNNTDNKYSVSIIDNDLYVKETVASITTAAGSTTYYGSMEDALADAAEMTEDVTINVLKDTTLKSDFYSIQSNLTITAEKNVTITLEDKTVADPRTQHELYFGKILEEGSEAPTDRLTVKIGENITLDGADPQQTIGNVSWLSTDTRKGYADVVINGKVIAAVILDDNDLTINGTLDDQSDRMYEHLSNVVIDGTGKEFGEDEYQVKSSAYLAYASNSTFENTKAYFNAAVDNYANNVLAVVANYGTDDGTASATLDNAQLTFTNNLITVGTYYDRWNGEYVNDKDTQTSTLTMTAGSSITGKNSDFIVNGAKTVVTLDNTSSIMVKSFTNSGSINLGYNTDSKTALITVTGAVTNTGTITVDMTDAKEDKYLLIDGGEGSDYGDYKIAGSGYTLEVENNDLYAVKDEEPTPGKDYVVNSAWAGKTYGDTITITKDDGVTYSYTFGENAFSNVTGEDGVLTKIKPGKIITLYSDLSETGDFHIDKAYQINLNGFNYETTGDVYDSITIRNSTDMANTFTGDTLCTADYGYFSVNGINTAVFDTVKNAGGTVYLYTTALLKTDEWINEEAGAKRGGRGEVYVYSPDPDGGLTESFYKVIDQNDTSLTITDYGWVGDEDGITPSKGNYLWFYWKTGWEQPLPEGYKWATEDGDLVIIKYGEDAPEKATESDVLGNHVVTNKVNPTESNDTTYVSHSIEGDATNKNVVIVADDASKEMKITGDVTSGKDGDVTVSNSGESLHITRDVTSDETTTITTGGEQTTTTVEIGGKVSGGKVVIENTKESGDSTVSATNGFEAETLEIRNETSQTLSASGKLNVADIRIFNNDETSATKAGTIEITDQINASAKIEITNGSETTKSGTVDLGTQEHTAAEGLVINNAEENIINGGYDESKVEQAANVTVADGDVVINNDGHLNMNLTAANSDITIANTSKDTLITNTEGEGIKIYSSGAIKDSTFTADSVTLSLNGTISNTQITAGDLTFNNAYQVVSFDWSSSKNFTFTQGFTVNNSKVVIDAYDFTGDSYRVIDNKSITEEDYSNVILSNRTKGYSLVAKATEGETGEGADLYLVKNTDAPTFSTELSNVYDDGTTKWIGTVNAAKATVTVTDNSGSGIDENSLLYSINDTGSYDYKSGVAVLLNEPADENKDTTYKFNAADNNGNTNTSTLTYKLDKSGPAVTIDPLGGYKDAENTYWYKQGTNATISAAIEDNLSGVKASTLNGELYVSKSKARIETLYETITPKGEKTYDSYQFKAVDNVGNETEGDEIKIGVDGTGPSISETTLAGSNVYGEWIKAGTAATVTSAITDKLSGFASATLDNSGNAINYDGSKFTLTAEMTKDKDTEVTEHLITATDNVGNVSYKAIAYGIDGTGPMISQISLTEGYVAADSTVWLKQGTTVALVATVTDHKSGVKEAQLSVNGTDTKFTGTAFVDTSAEAATTYQLKAEDNVGNTAETKVKTINVDGTGPQITVTQLPGAQILSTSVTVTATFADKLADGTTEGSGVATQQYSFNGVDWINYTKAFTVTENKTIYFRATDNVGNESTTEFVVSNIYAEENPYVIDGVTRSIKADLTCSDFSVINRGVLDGETGNTLTADNLYLKNGSVKDVNVTVDNIIVQGGVNDISGIDNLLVKANVTVESGKLTVTKAQYDVLFNHVDLTVDGALIVTGAETVSQKEIERFQTSKSIRDITFDGAELKDINKLTFTGFTQESGSDGVVLISDAGAYVSQSLSSGVIKLSSKAQRLAYDKLTGTDKNDNLTVDKNASIVLYGDIDLGKGSNTFTVKSNGQLILDAEKVSNLSNVTTFNVNSGSVYKVDRSSYQEYTELVAGNISFSEDRTGSFTIGNFAKVMTGAVEFGEKNDKLTIGKDSLFTATGTIDFDAGKNTLNIGSCSTATFNTVSGLYKLTVSNGKAGALTTTKFKAINASVDSKENDLASSYSFGNYTSTTVEDNIELYDKNDTLKIGNNSTFTAGGSLYFEGGNDTLTVGKNSSFTAGYVIFDEGNDTMTLGDGDQANFKALFGDGNDTLKIGKASEVSTLYIDFGVGNNKLTVGSQASFTAVEFEGTMNKFVVTAGTRTYDKATKQYVVNATNVNIASGINGTAKADTLSIGNYSDVNIHGLINLKGTDETKKQDTLTVGNYSTVVLKASEVDTLKKFTIGKESTAYLSSELFKAVTKADKTAIVYDIGTAEVAQNFTSAELELEDNTVASELYEGIEYNGWLGCKLDTKDMLKVNGQTKLTVAIADFADFKFSAELSWTESGDNKVASLAGITDLTIELNESTKKGVAYQIA